MKFFLNYEEKLLEGLLRKVSLLVYRDTDIDGAFFFLPLNTSICMCFLKYVAIMEPQRMAAEDKATWMRKAE